MRCQRMVHALVNISPDSNRTLNVVKAIYGLKDKSQAIDKVVQEYRDELLEGDVREGYLRKLKRIEKQPGKRGADVDKYFGLK